MAEKAANAAARVAVKRATAMAARAAYRATLDECGRGDDEAYRAMEKAEEEWDLEAARG